MSEYTAYKVRLYPNQQQEVLLAQHFGCARFVYNKFLAAKIALYKKSSKNVSYAKCSGYLPALKKKYLFLADVDATSLQQSLKDLDTAYKNFFRRVKTGGPPGFPKFKAKHSGTKSFRVVMNCAVRGDSLKAGKAGLLRYRCLNAEFSAATKIQSITVSQDPSGKYYASILVKQDTSVPNHIHKYERCGIDVGVAVPLTLALDNGSGRLVHKTTGLKFKKALTKKEQRRKHYQRILAKKVKGSKNRIKARRNLARAFEREANFRKNFNHKVSNEIARKCRVVVVEDLNVKNMTGSAKGTLTSPGINVSAKAGLNREILSLGWSQLTTFLSYKTLKYGGKLVRVNAKFTSQTCSSCGVIDKRSRENQSRFCCVHCSFTLNADKNAANNILSRHL